MGLFTDSIVTADLRVELKLLRMAENHWVLRVSNIGSIFLAFFPHGTSVTAGKNAALENVELSLRGSPFLNPGESTDFDLLVGSSADDSSRKKLTLYYSISGQEQRWYSEYLP